jgi:hypothetical protein
MESMQLHSKWGCADWQQMIEAEKAHGSKTSTAGSPGKLERLNRRRDSNHPKEAIEIETFVLRSVQ